MIIKLNFHVFTAITTTGAKPNIPPGEKPRAGNECVYQSDGSMKVHYMDFVSYNPMCRCGQITKTAVDKKNYERMCCEDSKSAPPCTVKDFVAPECYFKGDSLARWALVKAGPDVSCGPGFQIKNSVLKDGLTETQMSCCEPEVTTTVQTTTPNDVSTTSAPDPGEDKPIAGTLCSFDADGSLLMTYMENCKPNIVCRDQEETVRKSVNDVDKCCCNFNKDLPKNENVPNATVLAPKCSYSKNGQVNAQALARAGNDLTCIKADNLMNYDVTTSVNPNDKDEAMSCCLRKDFTTIATTLPTKGIVNLIFFLIF
jgi:hypothetical protein